MMSKINKAPQVNKRLLVQTDVRAGNSANDLQAAMEEIQNKFVQQREKVIEAMEQVMTAATDAS